MYSDFVFVDRFLFELSCKNTHTHTHGDTHTHTQTHTHTDSNEYPIAAFSKNATIKIKCSYRAVTLTFRAINRVSGLGYFNGIDE